VTEAIFGLVGVVVGAGISGVVSFVLERRRERQRARASARLLEQELEPFVFQLYALRASVRQPDPSAFETHARHLAAFTLELWTGHRETLAASLGIGEWYSVMYAYLGLGGLRRALEGTSFDQAAGDEGFEDRVQAVESAVSGAVDTLGRRAGRYASVGQTMLRGSRWWPS
jgi:hypothetical protein